eukprot:3311526-Pyramimonas_sp.AAC.1
MKCNGFQFDGADFPGMDYALNRAVDMWCAPATNQGNFRNSLTTRYDNITSFYGSSCANHGKGALNTPDDTMI